MTWSSLIVYVDDEPDNTQRIEQACDLAKAHGAHLIGVSACAPETPMADAYGAGILMGEVLTAQHERAESALKGAEQRFRDLATRAEWLDALSRVSGDPSLAQTIDRMLDQGAADPAAEIASLFRRAGVPHRVENGKVVLV